MIQIIRSILSVFLGFVAATIVMMIIETLNGKVFFPELAAAAKEVKDRESMRAVMASAPVGAFLVVLVGWALGGLTGGFVTSWLAPKAKLMHCVVLGVILTLLGLLNNWMLCTPTWFAIVSLFALLPPSCIGGMVMGDKSPMPTSEAKKVTP